MKLAIMQPYFLPYIGYFQLIAAVDTFVVYDNIKYTKKGWINRNRLLLNGSDTTFTLPLKKGSDSLNVIERELATDFDRAKLLSQFKGAYQRAPQFDGTWPLLNCVVQHPETNLFRFVHHALTATCSHLGLQTEIRISSSLPFDESLKGQDKVLAICAALGADGYVNPIGGTELYQRAAFESQGLQLSFLLPCAPPYAQGAARFVPWLSIIDVLMFNPLAQVQDWVHHGARLLDAGIDAGMDADRVAECDLSNGSAP